MKDEKELFSAMITKADKKKFKQIAKHRQLTMAGVLREWISNSHRTLESQKARDK